MIPKILRRTQLEELLGLSRSAIYQMMADGEFPRPVKLGRRAVGWPEHEVQAWLQNLQEVQDE